MPPQPTTGTSTAPATSYTIYKATGFMAGPDKPPLMLPSRGRRLAMSIVMPFRVLIRDMASAPASATAMATSAILPVFGVNLTNTGREVAALTAAVTLEAGSGSLPNSAPPPLMLGELMFTSIALTPATPSSSLATWA